MKKAIFFILLVASCVYGQDPFGPFDWYRKAEMNTYTQQIIPCYTIQGDIPYASYTDFCAQYTAGQFLKLVYADSLKLTPNMSWKVRVEVKRNSGTTIWGQHVTGGGSLATNLRLTKSGNIYQLQVGDTTYNVDTVANDGYWIMTEAAYDKATNTLTYKRNDTLKFSRVTNMPTQGGAVTVLSFGSVYEIVAEGLTNIIGGANFEGLQDNIFVSVNTDTLTNCNFNNGVIPLDRQQYRAWAGNNQHSYKFTNPAGGYAYMAIDPYDPVIIYRTGSRLDLVSYYPIANGVTTWITSGPSSGVGRQALGKTKTNPWDKRKVAIMGLFTHGKDSTKKLSYNVALYNSATNTIDSMGSGIDDDAFAWDAEWLNSDSIVITFQGDSAGGAPAKNIVMYVFSNNTYIPLGGGVDTLAHGITSNALANMSQDTVWIVDGRRVRYWTAGVWTTFYTFSVNTQDYTPVVYYAPVRKKLYVAIAGDSLYVKSGNTLKSIAGFTDYVGGYTLGGFSYDAMFEDSQGKRVWCGGDFGMLGGVNCNGLCYLDINDNVIAVGDIGGLTGGYPPFSQYGAFTRDVVSFCEFDSAIVFTGGFRTVGSKEASCIAMWNEATGICALDIGMPFKGQSVCTYLTATGYTDLLVTSDGWEFGGRYIRGLIAGRYSQYHFSKIKPIITFAPLSTSINPASYPTSLTAAIYSPASRSLTNRLFFRKNYNGGWDSVSFNKTDSSLLNTNGYWTFNNSAAFTGSISVGDTVFYYVKSIDTNGNDSISSTNYLIGVNPQFTVPDDYILGFRFDTLTSTPVSSWPSRKDTSTLRQPTSILRPTWNSITGVNFDSSGLNVPPKVLNSAQGDSGSIIAVIKIKDTSRSNQQVIFHYREGSDILATFNIGSVTGSTTRKLGFDFWPGGSVQTKCYLTTSFVSEWYNKYAIFIMTYDSLGLHKIYINGNLLTGSSAPFNGYPSSSILTLGLSEGKIQPFKGDYKYYYQYKRILSASEIADITTSGLESGTIP